MLNKTDARGMFERARHVDGSLDVNRLIADSDAMPPSNSLRPSGICVCNYKLYIDMYTCIHVCICIYIYVRI